MKLLKKVKKGFTLVELIVVIAVVAILAAVSVGVYFGVTETAKKSNDQTVTNQMNKALLLDETLNGKPTTASEALEVLSENGFDVTKMSPFSDGAYYLWDSQDNKMILINKDGHVDFPQDLTIRTESKYQYYGFVSTQQEIENNKDYSYYLKDDYYGDVTVYAGVDTGTNHDIDTVTYQHTTGTKQSVKIYTDSYDTAIVVNGLEGTEGDDVSVYGNSDSIAVNSVGLNSLYVYGDVAGNVNLTKGRVVAKPGSSITSVVLNGNPEDLRVVLESGANVNNITSSNIGNYAGTYENNSGAEVTNYTSVSTFQQLEEAIKEDEVSLIYLSNDISYEKNGSGLLNIKRSLTIDGNGHTLTGYGLRGTKHTTIAINHEGTQSIDVALLNIHINNNSESKDVNFVRGIETRGQIGTLKLHNTHVITSEETNNAQPITIGGKLNSVVNINVVKSTINAQSSESGYGLISFNKINLNASDSIFKGYSAVYMKGEDASSTGTAGSTISMSDCTIESTGVAGPTNDFGILVFEANNISASLNNCTAKSILNGSQSHALFCLSGLNMSEDESVSGLTLTVLGKQTIIDAVLMSAKYPNADVHCLSITGGRYSTDPSLYVQQPHEVIKTGEMWEVK